MARKRQEQKSEASIAKALDAARELFSHQGYRATSMREIAEASGLSVGNLYHHFGNKEEMFERLFEEYWHALLDPELALNKIFARANFPDDLEEMAGAIEQVVEDHRSNILLIYVDVIEFRGQHIRSFYEGMAARFEQAYGRRFAERRESGDFGQADPMTGVMVAARWLFYFFTVEKCFGVPMHFGMSPNEAVDGFIQMIRFGLLPRTPAKEG